MATFDWDDNDTPLAYLITIRTYGTWLHGDDRSSVDLRGQNVYGAPRTAPNRKLAELMSQNMREEPFLLDSYQRPLVEAAIREVCQHRGYGMHAINVRTNHVHAVVSSSAKPEKIANEFTSYSTRKLRMENVVDRRTVWSRGESTRYLWKESAVDRAVDYVLNWQGTDLPTFLK